MRGFRWLTPPLRRRAAWAVAAALALPWLLGEFARGFYQPGLVADPARSQQLIDYLVLGGELFTLTMWLTWLIGCWVIAVMQGPRIDGDAFPDAARDPPK